MAKDPAFLFYPNDWIGGTMGMTFEEKGAYVELLMMQFNRGHMTKHMIEHTIGHLWVKVQDKFRLDKDGLYYNARLDKEKKKREEFTKSRRNNVLGKNQHTKEEGHMTSHMENENVNENIYPKSVFNNKPIFKNFNGLPEMKRGAVIELLKITQNVDVKESDIERLWEVFKVQHLTGENYYASEDKVYQHFINWSKTQKINNGTGNNGQKSKLGNKSGGFAILAEALNKNG